MAGGAPLHSAVELVRALDGDELDIMWQGIFDVGATRLAGLEALVRWAHPERGVVLPDGFLPAVERAGLSPALTGRVLRLALAAQRRWQTLGWSIPISVNVSPIELRPALVDAVAGALEVSGADPGQLTLEVTEQAATLDLDGLRNVLVSLSRLGVRLSLDDFGMGDSSLRRLQRLHFDELKIDRSFVAALHRHPTNRAITTFITGLAHDLGMQVVAEGVEDADVLSELDAIGVDLVQGFHLHRPCPGPLATSLFPTPAPNPARRQVS